MSEKNREELIEQVASAFRAADAFGQVQAQPHFFDLDEEGREEAAKRAQLDRTLEAAIDPEGLNTTVRAVIARIIAGR